MSLRAIPLLYCLVLPSCSGAPAPQKSPDRPVNRLAKETSPYLLQHQHNPVDWFPWGPEALAKAKTEDKPIFLSIGYSACHWCHVMEEESFVDPSIAALMNQLFVNIKVDREERPDLDEIYMAATMGFTGGHGGWPMSVFLTPDLQPFYAGTYFPREQRFGQPAFPQVLRHVGDLWQKRRDDVRSASREMAQMLRSQLAPSLPPGEPTWAMVEASVESAHTRFDQLHGGFAPGPHYAPKFPQSAELMVILREAIRRDDRDALAMVTHSLDRMASGGMYDQLGGGFHRYSTDRMWLVPHFEKMLYDHAQLVRLYLTAHANTGNEFYADVVRDAQAWLRREMVDELGGIRSAQDADSEGHEGKFFVWTRDEIEAALGRDDAALFCARYGVTSAGNFEGSSVLFLARSVAEVAEATGRAEVDVRDRLAKAKQTLFNRRAQRVAPATDDKVLAAWNGLAIAASAEAYAALGDRRDLVVAQRAAAFVLVHMRSDGRLMRTWRRGTAKLMGYLEDHVFVVDGLLTLFEVDADPRWLAAASELIEVVQKHFVDADDGAFCFTADDHEQLVARSKSVFESSTPSAGAAAALACLRLSLLRGDDTLWQVAMRSLRANHAVLGQHPADCPSLVLAAQFALSDPREVVVVGAPDHAGTQALLAAAWRRSPYRVVVHVHAGNRAALETMCPSVRGKGEVDGRPTAYVCRRGVCERPTTDAQELAQALR